MAIDSRYKLKTGEEVAYFPPIQNTDNPYLTEAAMHLDQANQLEGYGYLVDGIGAFIYLGTLAGTAADYEGSNPDAALKSVQNIFTGLNKFQNDLKVGNVNNAITDVQNITLRRYGTGTNPLVHEILSGANNPGAGWNARLVLALFGKAERVEAITMQTTATIPAIALNGDTTISGILSLGSDLASTYKMKSGNFELQMGDNKGIKWQNGVNGIHEISYSIVGSSVMYLNYYARNNPGEGWSSAHAFYISYMGVDYLALSITANSLDRSKPITEIKNRLIVPNEIDLSSLGSYADDAAANTGGVAIGFAYINSSTGAMHRRLS